MSAPPIGLIIENRDGKASRKASFAVRAKSPQSAPIVCSIPPSTPWRRLLPFSLTIWEASRASLLVSSTSRGGTVSGPVAIWAALQGAVLEAFKPASAYGAPALIGALAVCALYYAGRRRARGRRLSVRGFVRSIFPKRILLHPSSLIDMRLWTLNGVALASAYGMLGLGLFFWRDEVVAGLTHGWGRHTPARWPAWTILTLATVLQLLASEIAYWFAHYCFHKIPALWAFHKVHHSAEVMTTLTELRQHPVEIIPFMNL